MGGQHRNHWIVSVSLEKIEVRRERRRGGKKGERLERVKRREERKGQGKGKKGRWGEDKEETLKRQRGIHQKAERQSLRCKERLQA